MKPLVLSFILLFSAAVQSSDGYDVTFGILGNDKGQFNLLVETTTIPLIPIEKGLYYGVEITPVTEDPYIVELVTKMPSIPRKLSGVFEDAKAEEATKGLKFPPYELAGTSAIPMGFDEGDPLGIYTLEVYVNKKLIKTIEYQAIESQN